ncbi:hypothetical protein TNCV_1182671 [Trichonephila clavipes]|nr:hypothetical protein TNCV_1182671 [Trichonephila clavipes]
MPSPVQSIVMLTTPLQTGGMVLSDQWDTHNMKGLSSNPGEGMGVCKCIVPLQQGGTLNSRRASSPLVRLIEGEESREDPDHL